MISLVWFEISGSLKGFLVVDGVLGPTSTLNQPPPDVAGRARASALQATKARLVPLRPASYSGAKSLGSNRFKTCIFHEL